MDKGQGIGAPLVLLHGFGGGPATWRGVQASLHSRVAPTVLWLPGHGGAPAPRDFEQAVSHLEAQIPPGAFLVGYSLGGRLTLGLLAAHPDRYAGALVVGAHPGLVDPQERAQRIVQDDAWARRLLEEGLVPFFRAWDAQPLFAGRATVDPAREADRAAHHREALASTLEALSLGRMPDLRPALARIRTKVEVVAGERDDKFVALGVELARGLKHGRFTAIPGAAHPVPEQAPAALAERVEAALRG